MPIWMRSPLVHLPTLNLYILAQSLRHLLRPGDEVVVTNQDHEANVGCWRRLSEHGVLMREWRVGKADGELDITGLENLISDRTKLVCCTLCSNLVGTHNNMNAISEMAHKVGALVVADGVSYAPACNSRCTDAGGRLLRLQHLQNFW